MSGAELLRGGVYINPRAPAACPVRVSTSCTAHRVPNAVSSLRLSLTFAVSAVPLMSL